MTHYDSYNCSVNETANEQPNEDNSVPINDPRNLTLEATYINKVLIMTSSYTCTTR